MVLGRVLRLFSSARARTGTGVRVLPQQHPRAATAELPDTRGCNLITFLRREQRAALDPDGRGALFGRRTEGAVSAGTVLRVHHVTSRTDAARPAVFVGTVLAVRRHVADPTVLLRGSVDGVPVEQVFHIHSPLVTRFEVLHRAVRRKSSRAYWLRDQPEAARKFLA